MRVRNVQRHGEEKIELQMTPMIDVVFQLLIFFIMTFKIVAPEGDFNIKMPRAAPSEALPESLLPPVKITLKATGDGSLAAIQMEQRNLRSFAQLHNEIREIVGDDVGPAAAADSPEIELDCDYQLKFDYTMKAITAVSGYVDPNTHNIVKIIEKIKFSPPHKTPGD